MLKPVLTVEFTRKPGHLYFVDGDGDIGSRRSNPGHTPSGKYGVNHPNRKVVRAGIHKRPGLFYYLKPRSKGSKISDVWTVVMRRGSKTPRL